MASFYCILGKISLLKILCTAMLPFSTNLTKIEQHHHVLISHMQSYAVAIQASCALPPFFYPFSHHSKCSLTRMRWSLITSRSKYRHLSEKSRCSSHCIFPHMKMKIPIPLSLAILGMGWTIPDVDQQIYVNFCRFMKQSLSQLHYKDPIVHLSPYFSLLSFSHTINNFVGED